MKYAVYNENGQRLRTGTVPKEGRVIISNDMFLEATGTAKYTLIIWLDNTNYNQNFEMGNTITGRIHVYSKQVRY